MNAHMGEKFCPQGKMNEVLYGSSRAQRAAHGSLAFLLQRAGLNAFSAVIQEAGPPPSWVEKRGTIQV